MREETRSLAFRGVTGRPEAPGSERRPVLRRSGGVAGDGVPAL